MIMDERRFSVEWTEYYATDLDWSDVCSQACVGIEAVNELVKDLSNEGVDNIFVCNDDNPDDPEWMARANADGSFEFKWGNKEQFNKDMEMSA